MDINERRDILVTTAPGLNDYLCAELKQLGFEVVSTHTGGVVTRGSIVDCMKLNMHLRTAYNVLYLLREFRCGSAEALYKQTITLPWEKIIAPNEYLSVVSQVDTSTINNTMFASLKVKDAIVDRITQKAGKRPNSGPDRSNIVVNLFWKNDKAWLYFNTSGVKLSDRNYRKMPHKAPLRELLAASIIMATGYDGSQSLVLPMCGSGTLAIEAALIATNRAPGSLRINFGFMHAKTFDKELWQQIRADARKAQRKITNLKPIIATDIDEKAVNAARQNAKTAGVDHLIDFKTCDFAETTVPDGDGIVLMNPEYGLRLGEITKLEVLYKRIGDFLKQKCSGKTGYIFTGNADLAKRVGLKTSRRMIFYNGRIECRLLKYELYKGTK